MGSLVIIGGGPAGLAAAVSAKENGIDDIIIIERDFEAGGILNQCIHDGFGLHWFSRQLTGPEYAEKFIETVKGYDITVYKNTMAVHISEDKTVTAVNRRKGFFNIKAKAVILAMGCRERTRGAVEIPGTRPAGVYTAGTVQRLVNIKGCLPGKEIVILGSGDIGLIMARRLTLEGVKVKMVLEIMPYAGGLARNIVQCLDDYDIPLRLSYTVTKIHGKNRVEGVTVSKVNEKGAVIKGTKEYVKCDTLLLSVGLIPENELSIDAGIKINPATNGPYVNMYMQTSKKGVFACGNVLHVHDLVDYVSKEGATSGRSAALYIKGGLLDEKAGMDKINVALGYGIRYVVPSFIYRNAKDDIDIFFRVDKIYENVYIKALCNKKTVAAKKKIKAVPGEMEKLVLKRKDIVDIVDINDIIIQIEKI